MTTSSKNTTFLDSSILLKEIEKGTVEKFAPILEELVSRAMGNDKSKKEVEIKKSNSDNKKKSEKTYVITNETLNVLADFSGVSENVKKENKKDFYKSKLCEFRDRKDSLKKNSKKTYKDLARFNHDFYAFAESFDNDVVGLSESWTIDINKDIKNLKTEMVNMAKKQVLSETDLLLKLNLPDELGEDETSKLKDALSAATLSVETGEEDGDEGSAPDDGSGDLGMGDDAGSDLEAPPVAGGDVAGDEGGDDLDFGSDDLGGDEAPPAKPAKPAKKENTMGTDAHGQMTGSSHMDEMDAVWEVVDEGEDKEDVKEASDLDEASDEDDLKEGEDADLDEACADDDMKEAADLDEASDEDDLDEGEKPWEKKGDKKGDKKDDKKKDKLDEILKSFDREIGRSLALKSKASVAAKKSPVNEAATLLREVKNLKAALHAKNEKLNEVAQLLLKFNLDRAKFLHENVLLKKFSLNSNQKRLVSEAFGKCRKVADVEKVYAEVTKALVSNRKLAEGRAPVAGGKAVSKGGVLTENKNVPSASHNQKVDAIKKDLHELQRLSGIE